ncbi:hypothetical protein R1flu_011637 [Riccia fluitans]|uniref:Hedgehog protein Hint domain-containing protein n=1 Tax=Riccia fluitans TaxID=41844 RepID=A0ABD1Z8K3_9MARC
MTVGRCLTTGPVAPFCIAGMLGVAAEVGVAAECAGSAAAGCFPADAAVLLERGQLKPMSTLALGDTVAVRKQDGAIAYEDIYAFGHKDAAAHAHFVQISVYPMGANLSDTEHETRGVLELTPGHFIPVSSNSTAAADLKTVYKRAKDV